MSINNQKLLNEAGLNKYDTLIKGYINHKFNKINSKVDCDHRYEITGATNDEHNLAIEDQQMLINKISGRTLVRNQLFNYYLKGSETSINAWTIDENNVYTFNYANNTGSTIYENIAWCQNKKFILGNKYAFITRGNYQNILFYFAEGDMQNGKTSSTIFTCTEEHQQTNFIQLLCRIDKDATVTGSTTFELIDLTLAYGVGNEPTTVEEVLNDFPEYIPYDEGTFVHSNNKLISTKKNIFNIKSTERVAATEYNLNYMPKVVDDKLYSGGILGDAQGGCIPAYLKPNTNYTISFNVSTKDTEWSLAIILIKEIKNNLFSYEYYKHVNQTTSLVDNKVVCNFNSGSYIACGIVAYSATQYGLEMSNIQVEYGSTATNYEPYKEEVIEGIGELKAFDYVDNETDSTIYGSKEVDLGDCTWKYINSVDFFYMSPKDRKIGDKNIRCTGYNIKSPFSNDNCVYGNSSDIEVYLRNTSFNGDAIALKESLKGVKLLYELAQPTITESNLPAGMSVYKGGLQEQEGTIPYNIEKQYALSIASQVAQNIEIDREQQKQIDNMKVDIDHKQSLLLSGQNIKTFNGKSILGSGDLAWNDPMFLTKFNDVTDYVNQNNGIIDELLEGKTYRIYSDNDTSSSVYSFNVRLNLKINSGETKTYIITLPTKTKNFVDFRLDNIVLNGQRATLYYNVDSVDYTQLLTQQGDNVTGDYETYGWGALYLSGTYAAVFEPVEVATKEDFDTLTSDEQPLDGLYYQDEEPGYVEIQLSEDIRLDLRNINENYSIDLGGHKCVIINPNDSEIKLVGDYNLNGEVTIYNYANIPQICFLSANKGEIWLEALKSNGVNQFLVEFKNNCFIFRNVYVGEI